MAAAITPPVALTTDADAVLKLYGGQFGLRSSMLQDLESGRPLEHAPIVSLCACGGRPAARRERAKARDGRRATRCPLTVGVGQTMSAHGLARQSSCNCSARNVRNGSLPITFPTSTPSRRPVPRWPRCIAPRDPTRESGRDSASSHAPLGDRTGRGARHTAGADADCQPCSPQRASRRAVCAAACRGCVERFSIPA